MKHIMISIKPEYLCKILNKEKTLEIRKSIPKELLNGEECIVEIYCTKGKNKLFIPQEFCAFELDEFSKPYFAKEPILEDVDYLANGKVVAEFTLNKYDTIERDLNDWLPKNRYETTEQQLKNSCLTEEKFWEYGKGKTLYAWHIDNLEIYDTPKELSEFQKDLDCDDYPCNKGRFCEHDYYDYCEGCKACAIDFDGSHCIYKQLTRPPQSWCYIE